MSELVKTYIWLSIVLLAFGLGTFAGLDAPHPIPGAITAFVVGGFVLVVSLGVGLYQIGEQAGRGGSND